MPSSSTRPSPSSGLAHYKGRWFVYILQAADKTLYTGIARNVEKRISTHLSGKGSRYLRGRAPLKLVYKETRMGLSAALKREVEIKKLTRRQKLGVIARSAATKQSMRSDCFAPSGLAMTLK